MEIWIGKGKKYAQEALEKARESMKRNYDRKKEWNGI